MMWIGEGDEMEKQQEGVEGEPSGCARGEPCARGASWRCVKGGQCHVAVCARGGVVDYDESHEIIDGVDD